MFSMIASTLEIAGYAHSEGVRDVLDGLPIKMSGELRDAVAHAFVSVLRCVLAITG